MRLSWNEIRVRAAAFAAEWADAGYEKGETQLFYQDFFRIFDVPVRRVASFEASVEKLGDRRGYIDLLWRGVLIVEQKSAGGNLIRAKEQVFDYFPGLNNSDLPRYVLLCDFQNFELLDLEDGDETRFTLAELPQNVEAFGFVLGVQKRRFRDQDPVNIEASQLVGRLHDALAESGYVGHDLERFLVRIVFCLFSDDTGIFEPRGILLDFLEARTGEDGADLGGWISQLFQVLNQPEDGRPGTIDEDLARFPYVDGGLFDGALEIPAFNSDMRAKLIDACRFDWSAISPAIFGALFQSVMDSESRRAQGAHYTSEKNILKVIEPLFMDNLRARFERLKQRRGNRRRADLQAFQEELGRMFFFDPACGCGNFLIVAYREMRMLEIEVIRELRAARNIEDQTELDARLLSRINVDQFYGLEILEFPARIAETALWMIDHMMNNRLSLEFGQTYVRIPLEASPHIRHANAHEVDWAEFISPDHAPFVFGNPPFRGHQWRDRGQQNDMARVWGTEGQVNRLDYVTCWYKQALLYARQNPVIEIAFVATNSIVQGEQAGILWPELFAMGAQIRFAHRTFQWTSETSNAAAVHCVITGLVLREPERRFVYDYDDVRGDPHLSEAARLNGYLIDAANLAIRPRARTPAGRKRMIKGSQPTDGARLRLPEGGYITRSNLILDNAQREALLAAEPECERWLRPYVGSDELISGEWRWCFWLKDVDPAELRRSREITERLERVREGRLQSPTASVRDFAEFPTLFTQDRQPDMEYLAIPETSSEAREYIPMAMLSPNVIASNALKILPGATLFDFGMLTSAMHMAWTRAICGRLESRYRYAPTIYNVFPWPETTARQQANIETFAQSVLDARASFPNASLADLYDPNAMPPELRRAHNQLDRAVDRLYRRSIFKHERERMEYLFALYESSSAPLASP